MILLRLILILTAIALVMSFGLYVLTNDNRYLRYTRQIVRFVVFVLLILGHYTCSNERCWSAGGFWFNA